MPPFYDPILCAELRRAEYERRAREAWRRVEAEHPRRRTSAPARSVAARPTAPRGSNGVGS